MTAHWFGLGWFGFLGCFVPECVVSQVEGQDLFKLKYQGIRPAPGYPSQPDHTEKRTMWDLLNVSSATSGAT